MYFPYTKFRTTSHLLWLYILACVGPGQKPRRPVFSQRGSHSIPRKTNSAKTAICTTNMLQSLDMTRLRNCHFTQYYTSSSKNYYIKNFFFIQYYMSCVMRKPESCICKNKDADQLHSNRKADQCLCFSYTVQSLYFPYTKFRTTSHLLWLYILACVGPGQKPRRPVFSQRGSYSIPRKTNSVKTAICTTNMLQSLDMT